MSDLSRAKTRAGQKKQAVGSLARPNKRLKVMPDDASADPWQIIVDLQRKLDARDAALRANEERYALVSQAVAEGVYDWDIEHNALWVSPRLIEIFGLTGDTLHAADWNERVHPDDFNLYRTALRDCFKAVTTRLHCEYRIRLTTGVYRWVEDHGLPVRDGSGRAVRLVGAVSDITDRKEGEQALRESLEHQTATAEVLQVINASPGDLAPVFDAMLDKALRLCEAAIGMLWSFDGEYFRAVATRGLSSSFAEFLHEPQRAGPDTGIGRIQAGESVVHVADYATGETYGPDASPLARAFVELAGARTGLIVALRKEESLLGAIRIFRQEVRPFTDKQLALLQNFAAQE